MNKIAIVILLTALMSVGRVQAEITVKSVSSFDYDEVLELDINIDKFGRASTKSADFEVSGDVQEKAAFGKTILLEIAAAKNVSIEPHTRGKLLTSGFVNRDNHGAIGISWDPGSGGIGQMEGKREGLVFFIDNRKGIKSSLYVQITKLTIQYLGADESFSVVNTATREVRDFSGKNLSNGDGDVEVSKLNLCMRGGRSGVVAALCSGDMPQPLNNFRVNGLKLEISGSPQ